jgi:hypothetical protein
MRRKIILTGHARFEAKRRRIAIDLIHSVVAAPQQHFPTVKGRTILQSKYYDPVLGREMLLRVIVERRETADLVITAYKTSKIEKYWMEEKP